jgi:hypothetical protein
MVKIFDFFTSSTGLFCESYTVCIKESISVELDNLKIKSKSVLKSQSCIILVEPELQQAIFMIWLAMQ